MADQVITGKVRLAHSLTVKERAAFIARLIAIAVKNNIWVNTCGSLKSAQARWKYPDADCAGEGFIPFEITDSEEDWEADRIFGGILYSNEDFRVADLSRSGLPDVQVFLEEVIKEDEVSGISISFDLAHGCDDSEYAKLTIKAKELCNALMRLPNKSHVPISELLIVKDKRR